MIECNYNRYFQKIRSNNRVYSVPVLKNTCINCKNKKECNLHRFTNPRRNNEILIRNLLELKDYIKESLFIARNIQKDIDNGLYSDSYTFKVVKLSDAPLKGVIYKNEDVGYTVEYTVEEYLEEYPEEADNRKLVGVHKVEEVDDVCYGLNIQELESDLEYINEELSRLNINNRIVERSV